MLKNNQQVFSEIYGNKMWGHSHDAFQPYYSGPGSHDPHLISAYLQAINELVKEFKHKPSVVDLGCGDFSVGSKIRHLFSDYTACDVVGDLIDFNKNKFQEMNVKFMQLDISRDDLPDGEIVFIRQVLQHLSNADISSVVQKVIHKYEYLVLTEHLPFSSFTPNIDKLAGANIRLDVNSGVVLTEAPFNMRASNERTLCEIAGYGGIIQTKLYKFY